jgi:urease accessory protein
MPHLSTPTATRTKPGRQLALAAAAGLGLSLLSAVPVQAHGMADGGLLAGASHPLLGLDHLLLLLGVGGVAAYVSGSVLLFALGGALVGAVLGSLGGNLPAAEVWAALAVSGLGLLPLQLQLQRSQRSPQLGLVGSLVAAAVAVHAMLHGLEAPADGAAALWWLGAFAGSALVSGGSFLLLRRLPLAWNRSLALLLALSGGVAALAPIGLLR